MTRDKFILLSAMLLAIALIVIGCAGTAPTVAPPAGATSAPAATTAPAGATQAPAAAATPAEAPPKPLTILPWSSPSTPFSNITVNVVGDAGHNLLPYQFWKDDFTKAGVNIKTIEVPFEGVYDKEKTEFVAGTCAFDVATFYPAYVGDFAGNGYLEPLDSYISKSPAEVWDPHQNNVLPAFRELYNKYGGKTYALTIDGDAHMLIYRKDLFDNADEKAAFKAKYNKDLKPPETWDDWLQVGQFFTRKKGDKLAGQTLDRDFYGTADLDKRGFSYAWFVDRWAPYGQLYFDANMKPQINTPEATKALQNLVDSLKSSPPDVRGYGYDELRDALIKGNVAMVVQWTDVPKKGADPVQSSVVGKLGYGRVPGQNVGGTVVHRAIMPVGRVVAVTACSKNKDAAYWVAKHIAYDRSMEDVSTALTGLDVYRTEHFQHPEVYTDFKDTNDAKNYLTAVQTAIGDGYPEIFIPGAAQYNDSLDLHVNKALAGEEKPQQALDAVAKEWDAITDKLGRPNQIKFWTSAMESYKAAGLIK